MTAKRILEFLMTKQRAMRLSWPHVAIACVVAGLVVYHAAFRGSGGGLVVYCAHDAIYAQEILQAFQRQTGIKLDVRFDTEATKSLGLTELILRERNNPRCDVFWNNELLGTLDLADAGVLEAYTGPSHARIPPGYKDADGRWTGFAARVRVWIINTDQHEVSQSAIAQTLSQPSLSRVTLAKPLFGTTRTHYTALWAMLGREGLEAWHRDWRARGLIEAQSNGQTMRLVSGGQAVIGWTDTDDYFLAKDRGAPVAMLPALLDDGRAIVIPNTVSIVRGSKRMDEARQLVDFLLSEQVEVMLANSAARQIPLGPVATGQLPQEVRDLLDVLADEYPLSELGAARGECLDWLKREYLQ
jgi:iron(III) transport system substrate-binding protein